MIHSTGKYGSIYFIGTHHSNTSTQEIITEIGNSPIHPNAICVEAPNGLDPDQTTEHQAVDQYSEHNNVPYKCIDQKRGDYIPQRNSITIKNIDEFDDPQTKEEITKGYEEAINPESAEHRSERDQMMALEIKEHAEKYRRIIVIVGGLHVAGIIESLDVLDQKYGL